MLTKSKLHDKKIFRNRRGIGLVETIVALGISIMILTALISLSVYTLRSSLRGKLFLKGSKLANNELELIRAYRDSGITWQEFITDLTQSTQTCGGSNVSINCNAPNQCHMDTNGCITPLPGVKSIGSTPQETINVSFSITDPVNNDGVQLTDNLIRVGIQVNWTVGTQQSSYIYSDFSNWREVR